jgi:hypothetical protein
MSALSTNSAATNPTVAGLSNNNSSTLAGVLSSSTRVIAIENTRDPQSVGDTLWPGEGYTNEPLISVLDVRDFSSLGCSSAVFLPTDPQNENPSIASVRPAIQNDAHILSSRNRISWARPARTKASDAIVNYNDVDSSETNLDSDSAPDFTGWKQNNAFKPADSVSSGFGTITSADPDNNMWNNVPATNFNTADNKVYRVADETVAAVRPYLSNPAITELYVRAGTTDAGVPGDTLLFTSPSVQAAFKDQNGDIILRAPPATPAGILNIRVPDQETYDSLLGRSVLGFFTANNTVAPFAVLNPFDGNAVSITAGSLNMSINNSADTVTIIDNAGTESNAANRRALNLYFQTRGANLFFGPAVTPTTAFQGNTSDATVAPGGNHYVTLRLNNGSAEGTPLPITFSGIEGADAVNNANPINFDLSFAADVNYELFEDSDGVLPANVNFGDATIKNFTILGDPQMAATPTLLSFGPDTQTNALSLHNNIFGSNSDKDEEKSTIVTMYCMDNEPDSALYVGTARETYKGSGLYVAGRPNQMGNFVTFSRNLQDALDAYFARRSPHGALPATTQYTRAAAVQVTSNVATTKFSIKLLVRWIPRSDLPVNSITDQPHYSINFSVVDRETTTDTTVLGPI